MKRILVIAVLLLAATTAEATDFASHHLLVPIAGRTGGAFGSQWKTDLVVTNAARNGEPVSVQIFFIEGGTLTHPIAATLWPRQSAVVNDVVREFGKEQATGLMLIATSEPDAKITARARIYNTGGASGQYGQTVQAMPLTKLSTEAVLPGLSGVNGNRTNVGIANPGDKRSNATVSIFDREGEFRGSFTTSVEAYSVLQLNDVFSYFQTGPLDSATIALRTSTGVYAYASIVRNDTGDADFVTATGTEIDDTHALVTPPCASVAQLSLAALPAAGWTVLYKPGINPHTTTVELENKHNFVAKQVYDIGFFYTEALTAAQVAALRCESSIRVIEQNGYVPIF